MVTFEALIKKFADKGEKTGWSYTEIPQPIAEQICPGTHVSFRVKGWIDELPIACTSLLPMGQGDFILPFNATIRKSIGKNAGQHVKMRLEFDDTEPSLCPELMDCLGDEPEAHAFFDSLSKSHQRYFSKWIESAKTDATKEKRILMTVDACARKMGYPEMIRWHKGRKDELLR